MRSPAGWAEPGQRPDFDEFTLVLAGALRVEYAGALMTVQAGQAVHTAARASGSATAAPTEPCEYVAICLPAFSPSTVTETEGAPRAEARRRRPRGPRPAGVLGQDPPASTTPATPPTATCRRAPTSRWDRRSPGRTTWASAIGPQASPSPTPTSRPWTWAATPDGRGVETDEGYRSRPACIGGFAFYWWGAGCGPTPSTSSPRPWLASSEGAVAPPAPPSRR
ncbi:MAG: hypothetical protein R3F43_31535 [bacterium]